MASKSTPDANGGGLPCDLPLDGGSKPRQRIRSVTMRSVVRRRRMMFVGTLVLLVLAGVVFFNLRATSASGGTPGEVVMAASKGVDEAVTGAVKATQDVKARAERGEGLIAGVICIDAGHGGGYDLTLTPVGPGSSEMQYVEPGGTSGVVTGAEEADVNLAVALLLRDKLREAGLTVVMVREDDSRAISSEERAAVANEAHADLFIRLHCDGSDDPYAQGFATLVPGYNDWTSAAGIVESSYLAAQIMHPVMLAYTAAQDAGIVQRYDLAGFNFCEVPSVLFEMGFMSNPYEDTILSDPAYQELLAIGMCDATLKYLEAVKE